MDAPLSVLAWQAPVANAAKMPTGFSDAAGVLLIGMSDRLGAGLPVVILGAAQRGAVLGRAEEEAMGWNAGTTDGLGQADPCVELQAIYAYWCDCLDHGETPAELEVDAKKALFAVRSDPTLNVVYERCLAIAELPVKYAGGEVPTFSKVMAAVRDTWRALSGRDVRIDGPHAPVSSTPFVLAALAASLWYVFRR